MHLGKLLYGYLSHLLCYNIGQEKVYKMFLSKLAVTTPPTPLTTPAPPNPCEPNPCKNGGTCEAQGGNFTCACPDGYWGKLCEERGERSYCKRLNRIEEPVWDINDKNERVV